MPVTPVGPTSFRRGTATGAAVSAAGFGSVAVVVSSTVFVVVPSEYPDELLAITLPAATYPLDIVQAARYLEKHKADPELKPDERWDSSIIGLLNYPDVVNKMNENLDWTTNLGDAVVNQQEDVMDAVQRFRAKADEAGNLKTGKQITIVQEKEIIKIVSAEPEVIYNPSVVIVQQPVPYAYVYSAPYPYYYNPAAAFWTGMFVGAAVAYRVGWHGHGHNDINIDRSVNISGNNVNRGNIDRGSGNKWKSDRRPGTQAGRPSSRQNARPGSRPESRAGSNTRARTGQTTRPKTGARPSTQTGRAATTQNKQKQPSPRAAGDGKVSPVAQVVQKARVALTIPATGPRALRGDVAPVDGAGDVEPISRATPTKWKPSGNILKDGNNERSKNSQSAPRYPATYQAAYPAMCPCANRLCDARSVRLVNVRPCR